ncbi:MAG: DUF4276 family protein [Caldilineaceae bacterium]|nr:DUF4276 family protein [Caldilineaceae bacterium]
MVIWIFAGGGESEVKGLQPFFQNNYPTHTFERKSPVRLKPGPKPPTQLGYGQTGSSLVKQMGMIIHNSILNGEQCDFILVIDDLDCREPSIQKQLFEYAIDENSVMKTVPRHIGFASPEIEAWIIADWDQTIALDPEFRRYHQAMRHWMSSERRVSFAHPEEFSEYSLEKRACAEKLSEILIDASVQFSPIRYSKAEHTPRLLQQLSPSNVSLKCPHFRQMHVRLAELE